MRFNDILLYLSPNQCLNPFVMKKNLLGAIVIFFVTLAFLLVIDDISNSKNPKTQDSVQVYEDNQQPDIVVNEIEE